MKKNTVIQIEFHEEAAVMLDLLQKRCGLKSRKEVLDAALQLFEWAVDARCRALEVGTCDGESFQPVVTPALEAAAKKSR